MAVTLQNDVLAQETHAKRVWSLPILLAVGGPAISVAFHPNSPARFAVVFVALIGIPALAFVVSGFQYRFLSNAVEIRTLGFCLRSIPRPEILGYSIEPWSLPRGYGIRAAGSTRAYVWGNKVVHIRTTHGDVFLGHSDPQRIVHDLDLVTSFVSRG